MSDDDRPTRGAPPPETWSAAQVVLPSLPGYRLVAELRRGGQGTVYEAVQESMGRTVAVKVLAEPASASPKDQARFEREVEALCTLDHPGIVQVFDSGVAEGRNFLVMPLVRGEDLAAHVRRRAPALRARLELFLSVCDAIHHAHQRGVLHRDLKPANILVDDEGRPHVLDFGLARPLAGGASLTLTGVFAGTLTHASPEQVSGQPSAIDVRTDVYALGVILFQLLTGELPFDVPTDLASAVRAITSEEPRRPSDVRAGLDRDLDTIVHVALAKDKERRYASVDALRADVLRYLRQEPLEARRDSAWYVLRKNAWRHRRLLALAITVVLVLVVALLTALHQAAEANRARLEAERQSRRATDEAAAAARVRDLMTQLVADIHQKAGRSSPGEILDEAAKRARLELEGRPEVERLVLQDLVLIQRMMGRVQPALDLARRSRTLALHTHGAASAEYLRALAEETQCHRGLGHAEAAAQDARQGLAIARRMRPPDSRLLLQWWQLRGATSAGLGRLDETRAAFLEGLRLILEQKPPDLRALVQQRINLALVASDLGHRDEAIAQLQQVLPVADADDGLESQSALARRLLAGQLVEAGRHAEAEPLVREAIGVNRCEADLSPDLVKGLLVLGQLLGETGRAEEGLPVLEEAAGIAAKGADYGSVLHVMAVQELATGLRRAGHPDDAEALHLLAHQLLSRRLADASCTLHVDGLRSWAESRRAAGDLDGARDLARAAGVALEACPELTVEGRERLARLVAELGPGAR